MHNESGKKKQELFELSFLFQKLGAHDIESGESPDFTCTYCGQKIGIEHVRCFPTRSKQKKQELLAKMTGIVKRKRYAIALILKIQKA